MGGALHLALSEVSERDTGHAVDPVLPDVREVVVAEQVCQCHFAANQRRFTNQRQPTPTNANFRVEINSDGSAGHKTSSSGAWDPSAVESDARHLFPIITPGIGKARLNSTHNVTMATFRVLKRELERGYALTDKLWQTAFTPQSKNVAKALDSKAEEALATASTNCWRVLLQVLIPRAE